jgi:hypothetical protein
MSVCGFYVDSEGVNHGFLLNNGVLTTLNYPGSTSTMVLGLNNESQVVGTFTDAEGNGFFTTVNTVSTSRSMTR